MKQTTTRCAAIFGVYLLGALLLTHQAWWSSTLIGGSDTPDRAGSIWTSWWMGTALLSAQNPFMATDNFVPIGQTALSQYNLLDAFLAAPGLYLFGPRVGFNLACVFTIASTAAAGHLLARVAGSGRAGAWMVGIGLGTSNFLLLEIAEGRLSQALLAFWFLGLAGLLRMARNDSPIWMGVFTGLALAATAYTYWYNALFLGMVAFILGLAERRHLSLQRLKPILVAVSLAGLLCIPAIWDLANHYSELPGVRRTTTPGGGFPGLDRGLFSLSNMIDTAHWPLWPLVEEPYSPADKRLPLAVLALAAIGLFRRTRNTVPWILVAGLGWVITLGPYLRWTKPEPLPIPLPGLWLHDLVPFFDRFWWPQRLEFVALTGVLICAALELTRWLDSHPNTPKALWVAICLCPLLDAPWRNDHLNVPTATMEPIDTEIYAQLDGALLTTPPFQSFQRQLWLQAHHHLPILAGLGDTIDSHRPVEFNSWAESSTVLSALTKLSHGKSQPISIQPADIEFLRAAGYTWAVVDSTTMPLEHRNAWTATFMKFFESIWGKPEVIAETGAAWRIKSLEDPVEVYVPFQAGRDAWKNRPVKDRVRLR